MVGWNLCEGYKLHSRPSIILLFWYRCLDKQLSKPFVYILFIEIIWQLYISFLCLHLQVELEADLLYLLEACSLLSVIIAVFLYS